MSSIKRIHVNQHSIAANIHNKKPAPVLTVQTSRGSHVGHRIRIEGPSEVIYSPHKPLPCGARCWIETTATVILDNKIIE